jgi:hypothetical protein
MIVGQDAEITDVNSKKLKNIVSMIRMVKFSSC